jgi:phosphoribosylformimino-5-aminoimidazole carboxamide ribotide isomerase
MRSRVGVQIEVPSFTMLVIPVIDIRHGQVVRAAGGDRANYSAIRTPLASSSEPLDVARGLLGLHESLRWLYIADLDGIEGRGRDIEAVVRLSEDLPGVQFLVDDGSASGDDVAPYRDYPSIRPVIGSETLRCAADLRHARQAVPQGAVLSLDWRGEEPVGPPALFADPSLWPDDVIVMTLARVGSGRGPDLVRLKQIKALAGAKRIYAAGGVRGADDVAALAGLAAGVLVASALHDGTIGAKELERLASLNPPHDPRP